MKILRLACLSFLGCSTFLLSNTNLVSASEHNSLNTNTITERGPSTGPEGENLFPGGGPGYTVRNFITDSFNDWNTSIFSIRTNQPSISNNLLNLPNNSAVTSDPITFTRGETYRITIGNLNGTINFYVVNPNNGMYSMRTITGNGSDVGFDYHHDNHFSVSSSYSFVELEGNPNASATSFAIGQYEKY